MAGCPRCWAPSFSSSPVSAAYGGFEDAADTFQYQTHTNPTAEVMLGATDDYQLFYRAGTMADDGTTTAVSSARGGIPVE